MTLNRQQTLAAVMDYTSRSLQNSDPRALCEALLLSAAQVAQIIQTAGKWNDAQIAAQFGNALVQALMPPEEEKAPGIVVPG